jgi:hypothetical protein
MHKHKISQLLFVICAAALCLILNGCKSGNDSYLYDRTGFDKGTMPRDVKNVEGPNRVAPDYYYRQAAPAPAPAQAYQPQAVPPNYQPYNSQGYPAASRYYSNPYAMPPSNQYPNYDADQYYVPPAYYNNVEPQSSPRTQANTRNY